VKKLNTLIFTIILFFSATSFAGGKKFDFTEKQSSKILNYHEVQTLYFTMLSFYKTIDKNTKYSKGEKTVFHQYMESLLNSAYAVDGEDCFFAGWPTQMVNGVCKHPKTHGVKNWSGEDTAYKPCDGPSTFRCAPIMFGPGEDGQGLCVDTGGTYSGLTGKCEQKSIPDMDKIFQNFLDKPDLLKNMTQGAEDFCNTEVAKGRPDHLSTCGALATRLNEVYGNFSEEKVTVLKNIPQVVRKANKALGILDACEKSYKSDTGFFSSQRQILGVVGGSAVCRHRDYIEEIPGDAFDNIKKDFANIEEKIAPTSMLGQATEDELELTIKNLYFSAYQFNPDLDKKALKKKIFDKSERPYLSKSPYYEKALKALDEIDKGINSGRVGKVDFKSLVKLPAVNASAIMSGTPKTFKNYQQEVNILCNQIRTDYENKIDASEIEEGFFSNSEDEQKFYNEQQIKLNKIVIEMKSSHHIGRIMATDNFYSKVFPFNGSMGEKCAEGDIANAFKIPTNKDIDESISDYEDMMLKDLDGVNENIEAVISKDKGDIQDQIREMLKYKPYLIGGFLRKLSPEDQVTYAKYICKESLDIYNSDENWRIAEVTAGGVGLVASGVLVASGFGAPVGALLAKGSAGLLVAGMAAEAGMAYQNYDDASGIKEGATTGFTLNQISTSNYGEQMSNAEQQERDAKISAALVILEPVAVIAKPALNAARLKYKSGRASKDFFEAGTGPSHHMKDVTPGSGTDIVPYRAQADNISTQISKKQNEVLDQQILLLEDSRAPAGIALKSGDEVVEFTDSVGKTHKRVVSASAKKNSNLSEIDRKKAIQKEYKNSLAKNNGKRRRQIDSIMKAHSHRSTRCAIGKCSAGQLKRKMQMMKAEGIPDDVIRDILRKGFAGDSAEIAAITNKSKDVVYETVTSSIDGVTRAKRIDLPKSASNRGWSETVQDIGQAQERMVLTVEKTMPDGSIKKVTTFARYNGTDGEQIVFDTIQDGRFAINPKDPTIKVTNVSVERPSYKGSVYTKVDEPIFEANSSRALNRLEGNNVSVKYTDEDGDVFDIAGEVVLKDGVTQIKYPNKYNPGQFYYADTKKLGDITEIQRTQPKTKWDSKTQHPRDIEEQFPQGTDVQIQYRKASSRYGSTEVTDEVMDGRYIGIVSDKIQGVDVQQLVVRKPDGNLEYIDMKNVDGVGSNGNSVIEFNGGLLPQ
jgi:hypothetical protein